MDPYMASIVMFAGDFAPQSFAFCQGQTLQINQNQALFSLLGTTYGGNGVTTFNIPDLRGRSPIGTGQGLGLSPVVQGEVSGSASVTLNVSNLPAHTHTGSVSVIATSASASTEEPGGAIPASGQALYASGVNAIGSLGGVSALIGNTGGNQPLPLRQPYLVMNFIICLSGLYPSRS